ncbi:hypothetical protein CAEBREN_12548 [Caenorhabditis brenneri]|uniref:Serpentine receptor class r-10 n=1 Tax=Caenorhabditis brenneri TaxID=135651 RepID=G0MUM6_CAEBE|nr:hypothetical protein CAEBREN_12548 [Caenorhabditis brenneri]
MHLHGASLIIYADSPLKLYKSISQALCCLYCASFGLCVSLLATHFVYRFLAICRPNDLKRFDGLKLLKIYIIPIILSTVWFLIAYIPLEPSDLKAEYMRIAVKETYNEDTYKLGYIGVLYYHRNSNGELIIRWSDVISCFAICGIMQLFITIILVCGWKTYRKMQSLGTSMSFKTKELNSQLFKTLILQTLVPMLTMFTPVGLLVILPMFSISVGTLANAPSLNAGIYPALDATIAIFMIRDFREAVICRRKNKVYCDATNSGAAYSVTYSTGEKRASLNSV